MFDQQSFYTAVGVVQYVVDLFVHGVVILLACLDAVALGDQADVGVHPIHFHVVVGQAGGLAEVTAAPSRYLIISKEDLLSHLPSHCHVDLSQNLHFVD